MNNEDTTAEVPAGRVGGLTGQGAARVVCGDGATTCLL